jgi:hypothetical protein
MSGDKYVIFIAGIAVGLVLAAALFSGQNISIGSQQNPGSTQIQLPTNCRHPFPFSYSSVDRDWTHDKGTYVTRDGNSTIVKYCFMSTCSNASMEGAEYCVEGNTITIYPKIKMTSSYDGKKALNCLWIYCVDFRFENLDKNYQFVVKGY